MGHLLDMARLRASIEHHEARRYMRDAGDDGVICE